MRKGTVRGLVACGLIPLALACGSRSDDAGRLTCGVVGSTEACICPSGAIGAQICRTDGTLSACECTPSAPVGECEPGAVEACSCPGEGFGIRICSTTASLGECLCGGAVTPASGGTGGSGCEPPAPPSDPWPANGSDVPAGTRQTLGWAGVEGAVAYDVLVGCPPPPYGGPSRRVIAPSVEIDPLLPEETLCWQVAAIGAEPDCYSLGPVWSVRAGCDDAVLGPPEVTSQDEVLTGASGSYLLTFSEPVILEGAALDLEPVSGSGRIESVAAVDHASYAIEFAGLLSGDEYTLTVGQSVADECGTPLASPVTLRLRVEARGGSCLAPVDLTGASFPLTVSGTFDAPAHVGGACDPSPPPDNAVYFRFVPPSAGIYEFSLENHSPDGGWSRAVAFEGESCDPLGRELACEAATGSALSLRASLRAAVPILVLFYTDSSPYRMMDPEVSVQRFDSGAGTSCALAADLSEVVFPWQFDGLFEGESDPAGSCDTTPYNQAWFRYVAPSSGWYSVHAINAAAGAATSRLAVFEGTDCAARGPELACSATTGTNVRTEVHLDQGASNLIVFHTNADAEPLVDPIVDIDPMVFSPGEACEQALDVTGATFPLTVLGDFTYEVEDGASCGAAVQNHVWLRYLPTVSGWHEVAVTSTDLTSDVRVAVFETEGCAPRGRELGCSVGDMGTGSTTVELVAGRPILVMAYTDGTAEDMTDPTLSILPAPAPPEGQSCVSPATVASSNYSSAGGQHCWNWPVDVSDANNDHTFTCDGYVGGDVVVEFTTGPTQTRLDLEASISGQTSGGYVGVEVTNAPCASGTSLLCYASGLTYSGSVAVTPNTAYYVWVSDAYSGHSLPNVDLCLW